MVDEQQEREMLQRVVYFWMSSRLRFAFDMLRCGWYICCAMLPLACCDEAGAFATCCSL